MTIPDPEKALAQLRQNAASDEAEQQDEQLDPVTTIELTVQGERGRRYQGRFHYHVPNLGEQIEIGRLKAVYLPQGSVSDPNAAVLVDALCYLQVCVTFNEQFPKPAWWTPMRMYDATPFLELWGRCLEYEARFHGRGEERREDAEGSGDAEGSDGGGAVSVGRKVPPPTERRETLAGDGA